MMMHMGTLNNKFGLFCGEIGGKQKNREKMSVEKEREIDD